MNYFYSILNFINQKTKGKQTIYINIPYTPEGKLKGDNPVSEFMIKFPIVIPTVAF